MLKRNRKKITHYKESASPLEENAATERINAMNVDTSKSVERKKEDALEHAAKRENYGIIHRFISRQQDKWYTVKETMAEMETKKEKISYLAYYYRITAIVTVLVLICLTYFIHSIVTHKDSIYNCLILNDPYNSGLARDTKETIGNCINFNPKKEEVEINLLASNIPNTDVGYFGTDTGSQNIFYQLSCNRIDTIIANSDCVEWFAKDNDLRELKQTLPDDLFQKLTPYLVSYENNSGEEGFYGIDISSTDLYQNNKNDSTIKKPVIAIFGEAPRVKESIAFIEELFK